MSNDTGRFWTIKRPGLPHVWVASVREDTRPGAGYGARVKWTHDRHAAKAWRTREAAARNAEWIGGPVLLDEVWR